MNELAYAVHALVTNKDITRYDPLPGLSQLEQAALAELENLLDCSPRDLAHKIIWPEEWLSPPSDCGCTC